MDKQNKTGEDITQTERRTVSRPMTVESVGKDDKKQSVIEGYAAIYNERANIGGMFEEVIVPGAFDGVLTNDVRALYNHDNSKVLARTSSGTLKIWTDEVGLKYRFAVPNRSYALDLADAIRSGDVSQSSFGFEIDKEGQTWEERKDGSILRTLTKFTGLFDVSPVTYPAYGGTSVSARSVGDYIEAKAEFEQRNKDAEASETRFPSGAEGKKLDGYEARYMFNKNHS